MKLGPVLLLPAAGLRVTAAALRLFASTGQRLADLLRPDDEAPARHDRPPASAVPPRPATLGPSGDVPSVAPVRLDLVSLAARPAPEVIAALDALGTAELADLYEHESKHRRRRAVLAAITAATAPPPPAVTDEETIDDDVRAPDELIYTTQTPKR